jgi:hypothetical protein
MSQGRNITGLARGATGLVLATLALSTCTASATAATSAAHPATLTSAQSAYLALATKGVSAAHAWWNGKLHWYNNVLGDKAKYPLASIWDSVPLFETLDEIAMASPTSSHVSAVKSFANYAEKYWNPDLKPGAGFAPYPGDKGKSQETWFDDNGWWGLAFMDAYQVTKTTAYLTQAENAFHFIESEGWDSKHGGVWWTTTHASGCTPTANNCPPWHSGEALGADTDLAARLYEYTKDPYYLNWAETFILWADANILNPQGYYSLEDPTDDSLPVYNGVQEGLNGRMPHDGEGAMLAALVTLCQSDTADTFWCSDAENLATSLIYWLPHNENPSESYLLNNGPQYEAILLRGFLDLYADDGNSEWYNFAVENAADITPTSPTSARYPDNWNGSPDIPGWPAGTTGQLQTQAANISVFADLATVAP